MCILIKIVVDVDVYSVINDPILPAASLLLLSMMLVCRLDPDLAPEDRNWQGTSLENIVELSTALTRKCDEWKSGTAARFKAVSMEFRNFKRLGTFVVFFDKQRCTVRPESADQTSDHCDRTVEVLNNYHAGCRSFRAEEDLFRQWLCNVNSKQGVVETSGAGTERDNVRTNMTGFCNKKYLPTKKVSCRVFKTSS